MNDCGWRESGNDCGWRESGNDWVERASSYHLSIRHDFCLDFNIFDYLFFAVGC